MATRTGLLRSTLGSGAVLGIIAGVGYAFAALTTESEKLAGFFEWMGKKITGAIKSFAEAIDNFIERFPFTDSQRED